MTGFGEAELETEAGHLRVEIRTVNHRFFNAHIRTPNGFDRFDHLVEKWLKEHVARGHVKYTLTVERTASETDDPGVEVDIGRARRYVELLENMRHQLSIPGQVNLDMLTRFGDIFRKVDRSPEGSEVSEDALRQVTDEAARAVVAMRETEGVRLQEDLEVRLSALEKSLEVVKERAPRRLESERERLRQAIAELIGSGDVDEERLAREVAYLAEKWDINEEIVRFASHIELFREILASPAPEPVGKRMGFAVQEMHREATTIGSKANDPEIASASMAMKEEIERLREQLENVE